MSMYTRTHMLTPRPPMGMCTHVPRREKNAHTLMFFPSPVPGGLVAGGGVLHMNIGDRGQWSCGQVINWAVTDVHWQSADLSILFTCLLAWGQPPPICQGVGAHQPRALPPISWCPTLQLQPVALRVHRKVLWDPRAQSKGQPPGGLKASMSEVTGLKQAQKSVKPLRALGRKV